MPYYKAGLMQSLFKIWVYLRKYMIFPQTCQYTCQYTDDYYWCYGTRPLKIWGNSCCLSKRAYLCLRLHRFINLVILRLKAFVHGALCYCYSTVRLLSSMNGTRSGAQRLRCAQPCRLISLIKRCSHLPMIN